MEKKSAGDKKKESQIEKVDLGEILKEFQIEDINSFSSYLAEIWGDLARRSKDPNKGIEKLTFSQYYELPGILLERLFSVFDRNKNGFLDHAEFIYGMKTLFAQGESSFNSLAKFIFKFYDFDGNGVINKEDIRVVLSYVPLQKSYYTKGNTVTENFDDRAASQEELFNLLSMVFGDKTAMTLEDYINVVENVNSDIFVFVLMYLMEKRPFTKETVVVFSQNQPKKEGDKVSKTPSLTAKIASPSLGSKFLSPTWKKRNLDKAKKGVLSKYAMNKGGNAGAAKDEPKSLFKKEQKGGSLFQLKETEIDKEKEKPKEKEINKPNRKARKKLDCLEDIEPQTTDFKVGAHIETSAKDNDVFKDEDFGSSQDDPFSKPLIQYEGYMLKMTHSKKLKKVYFRLIGRDFYYYKSKEDKQHKGMHNLSGIYIKKGEYTEFEGKKYYTFSILYPQKARTYYLEDEKEFNEWMSKLQNAIEHKSLLDKYEVKEKIGKGKFGLVKYAIQKDTGKGVAVKIMAKKNMETLDLELAKTEIDILKVSQHPNIIKLYDVFDTADYVYIIMEYCNGGDLFSYIEHRNYKLPEPRTCEIIHKLSMAIYYIHSYGIVHRDLKPENILMTSDLEDADIRLLDFGLSKIVGPDQKCTEPYGTLSFVAPEVLRGKPYDKSVDLWSIGIITYLLLCGFLPFDDKHSEREIARQTIQDPVPYPSKIWSKLSPESKSFVDGLLKKKPEERYTITQVLEHPWIKKFSKIPDSRMQGDGNKFRAYTTAH